MKNIQPEQLSDLTDEDLAARCASGIDAAERELLTRHMQAIYWLPQRVFGAPEEELSGFLLFAIEKIRERDILAKYAPDKGARFATWLGVVIRNLYIDYLRTIPDDGDDDIELLPEMTPSRAERRAEHTELIGQLQERCRVLFKLLLCDTFFLEPSELEWLAKESGQGLAETARKVAELEERLRERETSLQERYDKLAKAHYRIRRYQLQLGSLEHACERPNTGYSPAIEKLRAKLERGQREYETLSEELAGGGGIVTAPYKELAALLNTREGTLASNISRCRAGAAQLLKKLRTRS